MSEQAEPSPTFALQASGQTPKEPDLDHTSTEEGIGEQPHDVNARVYAEKYQSVEDLEKGYMELQQKFSAARPSTHDMTIEGVMDAAGLSAEDVVTNFNNDGQLSDNQYSALSNLGFSRQVVDEYLQGRKAVAQNGEYALDTMRRNAEELAGGKEQLEGLLNWASNHYKENPEEIDRLNERIQDPQQYKSVIKELMWDWKIETGRGSTHQLVQGDRMPETSAGFTNVDDLVAAMKRVHDSGRMDEATKRRIANTPNHILQGID